MPKTFNNIFARDTENDYIYINEINRINIVIKK